MAVLALLGWLALAIVGIVAAGFWGFLGVAVLYVLYYALLRPRVNVHVTGQEYGRALQDEEERRSIATAVALNRLAKAIEPKKAKRAKRKVRELPARTSEDERRKQAMAVLASVDESVE